MNKFQWTLFARFMSAVIWLLAKDTFELEMFKQLRSDLQKSEEQ